MSVAAGASDDASAAHRTSQQPAAQQPGHPTHDVLNQAVPLSAYNAYLCDPALHMGVAEHGGAWGASLLERLGAAVGSEEWQARFAKNIKGESDKYQQ